MKKSLILTIGAAALLAVSCGKGGKPVKGWSSDVKEMFKEHFNGNVLPYFDASALGLGELSFEWDDEQEMLVVSGGEITEAKTLFDLADKLESLGFVDLDAEEDEEDRSLRSASRALGSRDVEPTWPAEGIADWLWEDITDTVPAFVYDGIGDIVLDDGYTSTLYVDITLKDGFEVEDAIEAYQSILLDAGYSLGGIDSWGDAYYISPNYQLEVGAYEYGNGIEIYISRAPVPQFNYYLEVENGGQKSFFFLSFTSVIYETDEDDGEVYVEPSIPGNFLMYVYDPYYYEFPSELIASVYDVFGFNLTLPSIDAAYYSFYGDEYNELYIIFEVPENINYTVVAYEIGGERVALSYLDALEEDGWKEEGDYFVLDYESEEGSAQLSLVLGYYEDYDALAITFYPYAEIEAPLPVEWPTDDIAADFTALGFTDTLPEYSGDDALGFLYSATSHQLAIQVAAGTEAAGVTKYNDDLVKAGFHEAGEDSFGDMHYLSPNKQFDVCAWDGSAWGSDGYVVVDIKVYVAPSADFPVDAFNEFSTQYSLGFTLTAQDVASISALADNFEVDYGTDTYGYYHYMKVTFEGSFAESVKDVLEPILTAAGYSLNESASYIDYSNEDYHEVQIKESNGSTVIYFWE